MIPRSSEGARNTPQHTKKQPRNLLYFTPAPQTPCTPAPLDIVLIWFTPCAACLVVRTLKGGAHFLINAYYRTSKILEIMARQKMITVKMTPAMYSAMCSILYASKQTFVNKNDEGEWESNEDFICTLTDEEREALMNF